MPKQLNTLGTLVLLTAIVGLVSKDPVTRVPKIGYIDVVSMCCMSGCCSLVVVPGCCDWLGPGSRPEVGSMKAAAAARRAELQRNWAGDWALTLTRRY